MKILVSLGPIIGAVIILTYSMFLRIYAFVKDKKSINKKQKIIYKMLLLFELVLILVTVIVPKVTGESYLLDEMATGTKYVISETAFKVSYNQANRSYSNRLDLSDEELQNVRAVCTADKGVVFLNISQDSLETEIEITNKDLLIDMSQFQAGEIRFTLKNENAQNVKFELIW